jgi:hypothetical protein
MRTAAELGVTVSLRIGGQGSAVAGCLGTVSSDAAISTEIEQGAWARQGFGLVGQFQGRSRIRPMAFYKKSFFNSNFFNLQTYLNSNPIRTLNDFYLQMKIRE